MKKLFTLVSIVSFFMTNNNFAQTTCGSFSKIAKGPNANYTVGIKQGGTLWAWGLNAGQLGDGTLIDRSSPIQIGTATNWANVAVSSYHNLAIKADGTLWAWGANSLGQLGDGTNTYKATPTQIGTATNWSSIACGDGYSLAIKTDGTLWAWGYNNNGQLGDGTTTNRNTPTQIGTATNWSSIAGGITHTLAIKTDGTLWAWGQNLFGQLGDGTNTNRITPTQIGTATNWVSVACGGIHSLAIKTDGTFWAWGYNNYGQLGDGTNTNKNTPTQIGIATNWASIAGGYNHSLAIKADGTFWAWGYNNYGQLGDGTNTDKNTPSQISTVATSTTWNGTSWSDGTPNAVCTDAIISSNTTPGSFVCKSLTINSGYSLAIGTGVTVTVNGNIVNNGNGITGMGNLVINATSSLSGNMINLQGVITVNAGATLNTNNLLTLKSTSITNTAMIGNSSGTISGNVTVERYIPARRGFRLLAPGVTTTTSIKANWQEGQNNTTTASNSNTNAGYGTHITGSTTGSNGFDATGSGNPSLFTFSNDYTNTWTAIANTNSTTLNGVTAYRLMVRGSRAVNLNSNTATADATVLRATGTVNNGDVTFSDMSSPTVLNTENNPNQNYSMVPNPYWATINWATIEKQSIDDSYYIWDPTLGTRGAYASWNGTVGSAGNINQYIQPGQAFIVTTNFFFDQKLTIRQSDKATSTSNLTNTFRTTNNFAKLSIGLVYTDANNETIHADGAAAIFGNYSKAISSKEEAYKLTNLDEMLSINRNGTLLSIEARPMPTEGYDTLPLALSQLKQNKYSLVLTASNFNYAGKTGFVLDKYLHKTYPLNMDGATAIDVEVNSDSASKASDRLMIVLGKAPIVSNISSNESIAVYPIPAKNTITVSLSSNTLVDTEISIVNAVGSKVASSKIVNHVQQMNVGHLPAGLYFIKFVDGTIQKFVKE